MRLAAVAVALAVTSTVGACGPAGTANDPHGPAAAPTTTPEPSATEPARSADPPPAPPVAPPPPTPGFPGGLTCLSQHYLGAPAAAGAGFVLRLPDGTELPWDDARAKSYDDKLAQPDLEDTLSIPYTTGPIAPVTSANHDPGRIRSDALLKATFGSTAAAVQAKLVSVMFVGQPVQFHERAAPALGRVSARLEQAVLQTPSLGDYVKGTLGGTFVWRPIVNTNRMSPHSYGIAIDIVVAKSNYWEWEKQGGQIVWTNRIPQAIVDAFEAEGFAWGGRWQHYDTMHFEYRPELFDASCTR